MIITIDGPTASGKSHVAKKVAELLDIYYLNTGFLYRALGYLLITRYFYKDEQLENPDDNDVKEILYNSTLHYYYDTQTGPHVVVDTEDITCYLKGARIDRAASLVSANDRVRSYLLETQRAIALRHSLVCDGRDCGTIVFPQAPYKFFLFANDVERAKRWQKDQEARGDSFTLNEALAALKERDERDAGRGNAPLRPADDAVIIDSTYLTLEDVVAAIADHLKKQSPLV